MYGPIFKRETAISEQKFLDDIFFTQFLLSHASDNTTSRNIGGTDAWAVPPQTSNFGGDRPPSHP